MLFMDYFIYISGLIGIIILIFVAWLLNKKMDKIKYLEFKTQELENALRDSDEQAKLILKTDLELTTTQEELDKKIISLYTLQKISNEITTTLDEEEIFKRLNKPYIVELGFDKCLLFVKKPQKLIPKVNIGYSQEAVAQIQTSIDEVKIRAVLKDSQIVSSNSPNLEDNLKDEICNIFEVSSFIITLIFTKEIEFFGFLVAGNSIESILNEGQKEIINILSSQISQALENAKLFEINWQAQHNLEDKVNERTRELKEAFEKIQLMNKRKGDFVSNVSHELRTPLTSIKGYISLILVGKLGIVPPDIKQRLEKINLHTDDLTRMVNELLDISRIESGKIQMKQDLCDMKQLALKALELLDTQLKEKHITMTVQTPSDLPKVYCDSSQIERVFLNLINNAMKFTPANGKITVNATKLESSIQVDVMDTGIGINEDDLDLIFEEFYRVDNPLNAEMRGTGLGLPLVKHIIEAHLGRIWVKSTPNQGSTFSFTLPIKKNV